jgi:hypothetical protein
VDRKVSELPASSVGSALQLRQRRGHESTSLHGVHMIDGTHAAQSRERIIEPAGHPGGGVEAFRIGESRSLADPAAGVVQNRA